MRGKNRMPRSVGPSGAGSGSAYRTIQFSVGRSSLASGADRTPPGADRAGGRARAELAAFCGNGPAPVAGL